MLTQKITAAFALSLALLSSCHPTSLEKVDLCRLGFESLEKNENESAKVTFRRALYFDRNYAGAHYVLARAMTRLHRYDKALVHYDEAIACDPGLALAYLGRAVIKTHHEDHTGASSDTARAYQLEPGLDPHATSANHENRPLHGVSYEPWTWMGSRKHVPARDLAAENPEEATGSPSPQADD